MKVKLLYIFLIFISFVFQQKIFAFASKDSIKYLLQITPITDSLNKFGSIDAFYGVQFYKHGILYMTDTKRDFNTLSDYISFGKFDTYFVPLKKFQLGIPEYFTKRVPFAYPPGATCFSKDYKTLYFTKPYSDNSNTLKYTIFKIDFDPLNEDWDATYAKPLSFCKDEYSYMHPAISADGKILIFSSDMPAGQGGTNLFKSTKSKLGWSEPQCLGPGINSNKNEFFPYLDNNNNLFFSSNRKNGSGYDIFIARFTGKGWETPVALGKEINSDLDDMIFKIDHDNSLAVLVSFTDSAKPSLQFFVVNLSGNLISQTQTIKTIPAPPNPEPKKGIQKKVKPAARTKKVMPSAKKVKEKEIAAPAPKQPVQPKTKATTTEVIFRVQILSLTKPRENFMVTINNKKYKTWHYYYKGAYRYTVGAFEEVQDAVRLKSVCTKHGYPQAFVAAFRNNKRVLDPAVFKH